VNAQNLTLGLAFVAGFISFISPCVLPLVPAYIGYMGGRVTNTVAAQVAVSGSAGAVVSRSLGGRFTIGLHSLSFVAGFTFVFVTIGLLSTAFIQQIGGQNINMLTNIIGRIGGVFIIFFGLHVMGVLPQFFNYLQKDGRILGNRWLTPTLALAGTVLILWGLTGTLLPPITTTIPTTAGDRTIIQWPTIIALMLSAAYLLWLLLGGAFIRSQTFWSRLISTIQLGLYADTRRQMTAKSGQGYAGSAIMGVIFSAGWTPCIGPVYGAVLTLAANTGDVGRAAPLLASYSIGLGIPFILTALLLDSAQVILRKLQRHMHTVELLSGAFLVLIGFFVASGSLQNLSQLFATQFADVSISMEESVIGSLTGANQASNVEPTAIPAPVMPSGALGSITDAAASITAPVSGTNVDDLAPNFKSILDTGETIQLSDYRGQVVILNFWATWCGPCRVEMLEFEKAYLQYRQSGFTILAINNQETLEDVAGFRDELGVSFPLVMDEKGEIQDEYGVLSYPSTFVLNRDGLIIARHFGPLTAEEIQQLVDQALM
jgi:cytochrome c biogenesis protein CcdA/peroxiredoxin